MIVGTEVIVIASEFPYWDGERGRIVQLFTGASGRALAVIRLGKIALEVVFPVAELKEQ